MDAGRYDSMDGEGSECLEHIFERVFGIFAESKFLPLRLTLMARILLYIISLVPRTIIQRA